MIPALIKEVEDLKAVSQASFGGYPVEPSYIAEEVHAIEDKITSWKAVTDEILIQEIGDSDPKVFTFDSHWRAPQRDYSFKTRLTKNSSVPVQISVSSWRWPKKERAKKNALTMSGPSSIPSSPPLPKTVWKAASMPMP